MSANQLTSCDFCDRRIGCSNIFVALRILESEMRYCRDPQLFKRFEQISNEIADQGYYYPHGSDKCKMTQNPQLTESFVLRLRQLLDEIRAQAKISS